MCVPSERRGRLRTMTRRRSESLGRVAGQTDNCAHGRLISQVVYVFCKVQHESHLRCRGSWLPLSTVSARCLPCHHDHNGCCDFSDGVDRVHPLYAALEIYCHQGQCVRFSLSLAEALVSLSISGCFGGIIPSSYDDRFGAAFIGQRQHACDSLIKVFCIPVGIFLDLLILPNVR